MTDPFHSRFRIRSEFAAALAVTLAPVLYFLPATLSGVILCPDDGLLQNVPYRVAAADIVRSGYLPLWNPYIFSGMPLLASAQVGILFPLNWFYLIFSAATATNLMVISSYMVAALGAFLYSRRIGATIAGAAVCSLVWQGSGALVGQISHINIVHTSCIVPWLFWSLEAYATGASYRRGVLLAALIAIQFFAGHQQTFVYSLILLTVYAVVMAITNGALRRRYLSALIFVLIGIGIAAIQILPTLELLRNSERSTASYEFFSSFSMPKRFALALFAPYLMGGGDGRLFRAPYIGPPFYQEMIGYVGLLAIMLGIIAVLIKRDARTRFWAVVSVVGLLLAFGAYAPLQFYRLVYYVPLLNLFRVPARHVMEADFALAVLAGLGISAIAKARLSAITLRHVVFAGSLVCVLTIFIVTVLRPSEFRLGRSAPVTVLHAPELFLPILFSCLSFAALWAFAKQRRGATFVLFAVLIIDLGTWGQSSGWYTASPRRDHEYWREPQPVAQSRELAPPGSSLNRILTVPHTFDPAVAPIPPSISHSTDWVLWTQPDVYMMHGVQNAAGYDGFGLRRYSELAGRMKVWGELTDPDLTLRSGSREIDLLNVRYLVAMRTQLNGSELRDGVSASVQYGDFKFSAEDLGIPNLSKNKRVNFKVPPTDADRIAIVTNLSWAENIKDGTPIAHLRLQSFDGQQLDFPLKAGTDTAEWSHDRPDILARIKHQRATVATSYEVKDASRSYQAHTYVTSFALPQELKIVGGEIALETLSSAPDLTLSVLRMSLVNTKKVTTTPLRRDWFRLEDSSTPPVTPKEPSERWNLRVRAGLVDIYENTRSLPRVWLASEVRVLDQTSMLAVIRTGKFSDGSDWSPERTALIESDLSEQVRSGNGQAHVVRYEPNRIEVNATTSGPSILVLSENHYPGWRTYVDGNAVETLRVDYNLRGVPLTAGTHRVEFLYRPKSVLIGLLVSLLATAALISAPVVSRRRIKQK